MWTLQGDGEKVETRISWMNRNTFRDIPIDPEALQPMQSLPVKHAMAMLRSLEMKSSTAGSAATVGGACVVSPCVHAGRLL